MNESDYRVIDEHTLQIHNSVTVVFNDIFIELQKKVIGVMLPFYNKTLYLVLDVHNDEALCIEVKEFLSLSISYIPLKAGRYIPFPNNKNLFDAKTNHGFTFEHFLDRNKIKIK